MKTLALVATLLLSVAAHSAPWDGYSNSPHPSDPYPDRDLPGHHPPRDGGIIVASCAPEVVEGNINATERTLKSLATSPEFAQAAQFRSIVAQIASTQPSLKATKYFSLIGVDARDANAVASFVGAREVQGQWLSSLESTTGLSGAQADQVARSLQTALRGSLQ